MPGSLLSVEGSRHRMVIPDEFPDGDTGHGFAHIKSSRGSLQPHLAFREAWSAAYR